MAAPKQLLDWSTRATIKVSRGYSYTYKYVPAKPSTPKDTPVLLFLHGFPEMPQVYDFAAASLHNAYGVGVLLPNLLGYDPTSAPEKDVSAYAFSHQVRDITEILDHESIAKVIAIGRDWGSPLASRFPHYLPDRTVGLVLTCVQYLEPSLIPRFVEDLPRFLQDVRDRQELDYTNYNYFRFFETDEAGVLCNRNFKVTATIMMQFQQLAFEGWKLRDAFRDGGNALPSPSEGHPYVDMLVRRWSQVPGGLAPPLNWYKAMSRGWHWEAGDRKLAEEGKDSIHVPTLFFTGRNDKTCPPGGMEKMGRLIPDLETAVLEKAGHMIYIDDPEGEVELLDGWLRKKGFLAK